MLFNLSPRTDVTPFLGHCDWLKCKRVKVFSWQLKQILPASDAGIIRCVFICTHSGSHSASPEPPPSPDTTDRASSDANTDGTSGLKSIAGNNCVLAFYFLLSLTAAVFICSFLIHHVFLPPSEGNGKEVPVGKISFTPSEVLGHGSAGTFVFRYILHIITW